MKKRCLISVYDKTGIAAFARALDKMGWEIVSTGNTAKTLAEEGIAVIPVEDITHFPEILDGRVKTLSPFIFGGILFRREDPAHVETVAAQDIRPVDMVVNTLYPFAETVADPNASEADIIEKIDIGGPSLIRAAAKNHKDVLIVTDPSQYEEVVEALQKEQADLSFRERLARAAFQTTAVYEIAIANWFADKIGDKSKWFGAFHQGEELRYGENPHQKGYVYRAEPKIPGGFGHMIQHQGKPLSYNNYNDAGFAMEAIKEFPDRPTAVAVKHANPCGVACADSLLEAYAKCEAADPNSIFGGIVCVNEPVDESVATAMRQIFLEVIIAPGYTEEALVVFSGKKNLRVLEVPDLMERAPDEPLVRTIPGGLLLQDKDNELLDELETVTQRAPGTHEMEDLQFAWKVAKIIKSNGVVIAKNEATLGIGLGEVNRYWAVKNAIERAEDDNKGAVCASDAFFPFGDSVEALAEAGITAVIQPGGSIKDQESIDAANRANIAMVFTGMRHFRH
ncbi:MAG: bifunctional phosphoribosylaminoimidazolecarboxamide formyltransferase/IMP cyclohydrolase [Tissierellia bacterium]|nr:bifunctional phosphoribosylaminoimidazolecarboxamide formyltransferase/IMP cyclohydrolase [Tissierellia bacterium]